MEELEGVYQPGIRKQQVVLEGLRIVRPQGVGELLVQLMVGLEVMVRRVTQLEPELVEVEAEARRRELVELVVMEVYPVVVEVVEAVEPQLVVPEVQVELVRCG